MPVGFTLNRCRVYGVILLGHLSASGLEFFSGSLLYRGYLRLLQRCCVFIAVQCCWTIAVMLAFLILGRVESVRQFPSADIFHC